MQPRDLVHLKVRQHIGQPRCVIPLSQAPDQGGAIGFRSGECVEPLAGTTLADGRDYQVVGEGPVDMVWIPSWITNVELP